MNISTYFLFALFFNPAILQPKDCSFLTVEKIKFGIDRVMAESFHDTIPVMHITIVNRCKKCEVKGPDYCPLIVLNENNDTIASSAINGVPRKYKASRTYQVTARNKEKWVQPDVSKIKIQLLPYCKDLPVKL
ncbi:MAG: hypothetical protein ACOZCO_01670 [Bacteroidota bacterium]